MTRPYRQARPLDVSFPQKFLDEKTEIITDLDIANPDTP